MDSHYGGIEGEGRAEEGLAGQSLEIKVSSEPLTPANPVEQEPEPKPEPEPTGGPEPETETQAVSDSSKAKASEGSEYAQVEVPESPGAAETAGEAVSPEPESLPQTQPKTKPESKEPEDKDEDEEDEEEDEDEDEDEDENEEPDRPEKQKGKGKREKRKESRFRPSLPLTTIVEEGAAPGPRAAKEKARGSLKKRDSEEIEATDRERPQKSTEEQLHPGEAKEEEKQKVEKGASTEEFEWTADMRKLQEQQLRGELVEQYHSLLVERNRYQRYNMYLQQKIHETLRKKGLEAAAEPGDKSAEPESPEKEQEYLRYLAMLEELKKQEADDLEWYRQEVRELKQQCQEKQTRVEKEWRRFQALKKQVMMQVMGSCRMRGGRQAALREVEQLQALEDKKEKEMSAVRLENVQLKQSLVHFETRMKAQEDLAEGLLLIDFEQLKIENQTFNEKVEERNEELLKLRTKVTSNVQIITHVKEKLSFIDTENSCKKAQLSEVDAQVALGRDLLTKTKQARDSLRIDNVKLSQKCGLLGKESLLRDLEEKVEKTEMLNRRLESLKRHHAGLALSCKGVKQKIREAKTFLPS
ncbi:coiled-coil domain-containing protein 96 [Mus pahari]|uniref:coiled-coil domain-containing protein 96 n=1 Tax=Mus pahari TaxID=10093 RepID=UPI000A3078B4|nr:coiled-coil domain-containing protein 96 [Mus pahari]